MKRRSWKELRLVGKAGKLAILTSDSLSYSSIYSRRAVYGAILLLLIAFGSQAIQRYWITEAAPATPSSSTSSELPTATSALTNFDGDVDPSFNASFFQQGGIGRVVRQSDGKVIVFGDLIYGFSSFNGSVRDGIARLNVDGSLDLSFQVDTLFNPGTGTNFTGRVDTAAVQTDGRIIIGGCFTSINGLTHNNIARLNQDGSLDDSFNPATEVDNICSGEIFALAQQTDGKIVLGGVFSRVNGAVHDNIARLNADGSVDSLFNPDASSTVYNVALQSDGKILIGGIFKTVNGAARSEIARLNADGSVDAFFNPPSITGFPASVLTTAIQPDGKIVIGGGFASIGGVSRNYIARLNSDASLDNSFDPGSGADYEVKPLVIQSDGKIVVGGAFSNINGLAHAGIARLNTNGSVDASFNANATQATFGVESLIWQSDGRIVIGGDFASVDGTPRPTIARVNTDGSIDSSFNPGTGATVSSVSAVAPQPDSKIVVGSSSNTLNGAASNNIARLNSDGSSDTLFNSNAGANNRVSAVAVQTDGKILIGGDFTSADGTARNRIARVNADGTLDPAFDPGSGADGTVSNIILQNDGKILIAGSFFQVNGMVMTDVARLNSDGSLDGSFKSALNGIAPSVFAMALQSNGKIIVGGFNLNDETALFRLNSDGSLDGTFQPGSVDGSIPKVFALAVQADGKILVGGAFAGFSGTPSAGLARLNSNGSLDQSFSVGPGTNGTVHALVLPGGGKILVGGFFNSFNGTATNNIVRLNSDGSVDATFNPGSGPNVLVSVMANQADGNLIIGGNFTRVNGAVHFGIARIFSSVGPAPTPSPSPSPTATATPTPGGCVGPPSGMVSWWPGDSNANDIQGSNNGTTTPNVSFAAAKVNQGFQFSPTSGTTSFVQVANAASLRPNAVTVDAWVKAAAGGPSSFKYIVSKSLSSSSASYALYSSSGGAAFYVTTSNGLFVSPIASSAIWDGNFHLLAGTFDGSTVRLYVDGSQIGTGTSVTGNIQYDTAFENGDLLIGNFTTGTNSLFPWPGEIDEVELFNRALAGSEILGIFNAGSAGKCRPGASPTPTPTPTSVVQFSASNYSVVEDCTTVTITVNRVGDTSSSASVDYATADGTATERGDYITALGTLRFAAGETSKSFIVLINEDSYVEGNEIFNVVLSNPSGVSLGSPSSSTVTIIDDPSEPASNAIDDARNYVCQHYHDFLNRQPDQSGWDFWTNQITACGSNQNCIDATRINVSAAYFLSIEFQQTGYLVERMYKVAYGDASGTSTTGGTHQLPVPIMRYREFLLDTQQIGQGVVVGQTGWEGVLEGNKQAFASDFVQRSRFTTALPTSMTPAQFVNTLNQNAGSVLSPTEQQNVINLFGNATDTTNMTARAQALRQVAENQTLFNNENNRAFVLMQYLGYLRRNPNDPQDMDYSGWEFWLQKLNQFHGDYNQAQMVQAFITSIEYRQRFGP